jgi:hypothetical protein
VAGTWIGIGTGSSGTWIHCVVIGTEVVVGGGGGGGDVVVGGGGGGGGVVGVVMTGGCVV